MQDETLIVLERTRTDVQRLRIQMNNRLLAIEGGASAMNPDTIEQFRDMFMAIELEATDRVAVEVKKHVMWPWMSAVHGIGPGLAGSVLAPVEINRAGTVSALWRYSGQGVTDGASDRRHKGIPLQYNAQLKRTCYLVGTSFLKSSSPYRAEYDLSKAYYEANRDWSPTHVDAASRRKMVKLFLSHMWLIWRDIEGLPVGRPYAKIHPDAIKAPWDYVPDYDYPDTLLEAIAHA